MKHWVWLLILGTACTSVDGPNVSGPASLIYCGYEKTPCEEAPPSDATGTIVITVRVCVPVPDDPVYPYCP